MTSRPSHLGPPCTAKASRFQDKGQARHSSDMLEGIGFSSTMAEVGAEAAKVQTHSSLPPGQPLNHAFSQPPNSSSISSQSSANTLGSVTTTAMTMLVDL